MRILKYLFLLILLTLVALSIFVATQKGDFIIEKSKIINSPKLTVFNYVNDYRNWEDFSSWAIEDTEMKITYPQNTIGKGSSYSWEGKNSYGDVQTLYVKENDSLHQKMNYNGNLSDVFWSFKDTVGGTKVSWKAKGKTSFIYKFLTAFNGGINGVLGKMFENSLANLNKKLDYEINTYTIKIDGQVKKLESYYLKQTYNSKISNITRNAGIIFPKIITFCKKNNLSLNGKPFIIYHSFDETSGIAKISFCIPIKDEVYTSDVSDILSGKLEAFEAVKTTMKGDYSHSKEAFDKTLGYIAANNLTPDPMMSHLEIYTIGKNEIKNPSNWVTEIYVPVKPKVVAVKIYRPLVVKKLDTTTAPIIKAKNITTKAIKDIPTKIPVKSAKENLPKNVKNVPTNPAKDVPSKKTKEVETKSAKEIPSEF